MHINPNIFSSFSFAVIFRYYHFCPNIKFIDIMGVLFGFSFAYKKKYILKNLKKILNIFQVGSVKRRIFINIRVI